MSYDPIEEDEKRIRASRARELDDTKEEYGSVFEKPELSRRQVEFLEIFSACSWMPIKDICTQAHIQQKTFRRWMEEDAHFRKAVNIHYNQVIRATNMSRKQVMKGMLDAIDVAKDQRQATAMISGWKEIGRMCGFYEPERREVTLSVNSRQIIDDMKTMSRDKLMQLANDQDIIEGEIVETDNTEVYAKAPSNSE